MWLSLVEHLVRDQGVAGSNPVIPTMKSRGYGFPVRSPFLFCDRFATIFFSGLPIRQAFDRFSRVLWGEVGVPFGHPFVTALFRPTGEIGTLLVNGQVHDLVNT